MKRRQLKKCLRRGLDKYNYRTYLRAYLKLVRNIERIDINGKEEKI